MVSDFLNGLPLPFHVWWCYFTFEFPFRIFITFFWRLFFWVARDFAPKKKLITNGDTRKMPNYIYYIGNVNIHKSVYIYIEQDIPKQVPKGIDAYFWLFRGLEHS